MLDVNVSVGDRNMAPEAHTRGDLERLKAVEYQPVPTHQGKRILPQNSSSAEVWGENETLDHLRSNNRANSLRENSRLLGPLKTEAVSMKPKTSLETGLTLGVWGAPKKSLKCAPVPTFEKSTLKTKVQKRKEKLIDLLKPPYFVLTMITIIVCIQVVRGTGWQVSLEWAPSVWRREPWRLLSYSVVHAGPSHLTLNALVALAVGWVVEREQGWWRVAGVWVGGAAGGAVGAGLLQPHVRVVGASAAVYALLASHIPNVALRYGHVPLWWFRPLSVTVLMLSELCWSVLQARPLPQPVPHPAVPPTSAHSHIAWSAHALGAAVGVPLAFLIFTGENSSKRYMLVCRVVSATALGAGLAGAAALYSLRCEHE